MTTFSFTPLVAGAPELVSDINTPLTAIAAVLNGGIDDANINAAAAIDGDKIAAATTSAAIASIGAGFTNSFGGLVRRDIAAVARLSGSIQNTSGGSKAAASTVCTIQAGFRPSGGVTLQFCVADYDGGAGTIAPICVFVQTSGAVQLGSALANNHYVYLDGITYPI